MGTLQHRSMAMACRWPECLHPTWQEVPVPDAPHGVAGLAVPPLLLLCTKLLEKGLVLFCFAEFPADRRRVLELETALGGLGLPPGRGAWGKASALCGACPWETGHSLYFPEPCRFVSRSLFCATALAPSHYRFCAT